MLSNKLKEQIKTFPDFPKKGIIFKDFLPVLCDSDLYSQLINEMSLEQSFNKCDAILAIDARGFLIGSAVALQVKKPLIVARKPGKLPGELITQTYDLEYGSNSLSIQKDAIKNFEKFVIVDDLLATGGTVRCVSNILKSLSKKVLSLSVVIELNELQGREILDFPVKSYVQF